MDGPWPRSSHFERLQKRSAPATDPGCAKGFLANGARRRRFFVEPPPLERADAFQWMASPAALACFGTAVVLEVSGDKIPAVDHVLDSLGVVVKPLAAAVAAASMVQELDPLLALTLGWIMLGWFITWTAIELPMFQRALETVPLTGAQWALIIGLSLIAPVVVEIDKAVSRRHQSQPTTA